MEFNKLEKQDKLEIPQPNKGEVINDESGYNLEEINKQKETRLIEKFLNETGSVSENSFFNKANFLKNTDSKIRQNYKYTKIIERVLNNNEISLLEIYNQLKKLGLDNDKIDKMVSTIRENTNPIYNDVTKRVPLNLNPLIEYLSSNQFVLDGDEGIFDTPIHLPKNIKTLHEKKKYNQQIYPWEIDGINNTDMVNLENGDSVMVGIARIFNEYPELIIDMRKGKVFANFFMGTEQFEISNPEVLQDFHEKIKVYERTEEVIQAVISEHPAFSVESGDIYVDNTQDISSLYSKTMEILRSMGMFGTGEMILAHILKINVICRQDVNLENKNQDTRSLKQPLIKVPETIEKMCQGNIGKGAFNPWDLVNSSLGNISKLPITVNGETTNIDEIKIASFLHETFAYRDDLTNSISFLDPETGENRKMLLEDLSFALGLGRRSLHNIELPERFPHLLNSKKMDIYDFNIDSRMSDIFNNYGGRENPLYNNGSPSYRAFTYNNITAKYYFGREKFIDSDLKLEELSVTQIEPGSVAIISNSFGKKTILYMLDLLSGDDVNKKKEEYIEGYEAKNSEKPDSAKIASSLTLNSIEMKSSLRPYDINEYIGDELKNIDPIIKSKVLGVVGDYEFIARQMRRVLAPLDLGIAMYPWKEQLLIGAALAYLPDEKSILKFLDKFRENGLKTLTSVLYGGIEMGQKILDIAEKLPAESANAIFAKYAELVDASREVENFITNEFSRDLSENPEILDKVRSKLIDKGVTLLNIFHNKLDIINSADIDGATSLISEEINKISTNAIATLSTFKYAREHGQDLNLEDIKNSEFSKNKMTDIKESDQKTMVDIYHKSYAHNPEFAEKLVSTFNDGFSDIETSSDLYIYRLNRNIEAFARFKEYRDGKHLSAVNVSESSRSYTLGEALVEQAIEQESIENILYAETDFSKGICGRFLEAGFIAYQELDFKGVEGVNIICDQILNKQYLSKKLTQKEIVSQKNIPESVIIETYKDIREFDRSRLGDIVVTRSFYNKESSTYYVVLETAKEKQA